MVRARPKTPVLSVDYFPERSVMASHLRKLNELISAQRRDHGLRHHLAITTTSNDSYGGFYHTPRKDPPQMTYFDPFYRHSMEYGRYLGPVPKLDPPTELEIKMKKKQEEEQRRRQKAFEESKAPPMPEFAQPLRLPPIRTKESAGAMSDRTSDHDRIRRRQELLRQFGTPQPNSVSHHTLQLSTHDYMSNSTDRMWQNAPELSKSSKYGGSLYSLPGQEHNRRH